MDDFDQCWELLKTGIQEIQKKRNPGLSFEVLYRNVYMMVLHKHGDIVYYGLKNTVTDHLREKVRVDVMESGEENFLSNLEVAWQDHQTAMLMIRDILLYMASKGEDVKATCAMLMTLGESLYEDVFEKPFLTQSSELYQAESLTFCPGLSTPDFIKQVDERVREEGNWAHAFFVSTTEAKLVTSLGSQLIANHLRTDSRLHHALDNDLIEDLRSLYSLLAPVDGGIPALTSCLSSYLRQKGLDLVAESGPGLIQALLDLKDRVDRLLRDAFLSDKEMEQTIHGDFVFCLNRPGTSAASKAPEYLAAFIDGKLSDGIKGLTEGQVESLLDQIITLFRFISDKDVFERYYRHQLARRLLFNRSVSDEAEKAMISRLKTECGCHFTSKLEGMFADVQLSATLMGQYRETESPEMELRVTVLTTGCWPTQRLLPNCPLPHPMRDVFERFQSFYLGKHSGRKLTLNPSIGGVELAAAFPPLPNSVSERKHVLQLSTFQAIILLLFNAKARYSYQLTLNPSIGGVELAAAFPPLPNSVSKRKHVLQLSTFQAIILLLFNAKVRYSYQEIGEETGIQERELSRGLTSLALGKHRILSRSQGDGKDIAITDVFEVNEAFSSRLKRVKIPTLALEPEVSIRAPVEENRKHELEALLVRIMKAKQTLTHSQLVSEVTTELRQRFVPLPSLVKNRIEDLIERGYLSRDETDQRTYTYVA